MSFRDDEEAEAFFAIRWSDGPVARYRLSSLPEHRLVSLIDDLSDLLSLAEDVLEGVTD